MDRYVCMHALKGSGPVRKMDIAVLIKKFMSVQTIRPSPTEAAIGSGHMKATLPGDANFGIFMHKLGILTCAQLFSQLNVDKFQGKVILDTLSTILLDKLHMDCLLLAKLLAHAGLSGDELFDLWQEYTVTIKVPVNKRKRNSPSDDDEEAEEESDELEATEKIRKTKEVEMKKAHSEIDALFEDESGNCVSISNALTESVSLEPEPEQTEDLKVKKVYNPILRNWLCMLLGSPFLTETYRIPPAGSNLTGPYYMNMNLRPIYEELFAYMKVQKLWIHSLLKKLSTESSSVQTIPGRRMPQVTRRMLIPEALLTLFKTLPSPNLTGSHRKDKHSKSASSQSGQELSPSYAVSDARLRILLAEEECLPALPKQVSKIILFNCFAN
jgi:hypothetical protein